MDRMSNADISKMKREAIKRANDANKKVNDTRNYENETINNENTNEGNNTVNQNNSDNDKNNTNGFDNILSLFMKDGERILLIILIMILADEDCDMELIFALMYLII